MFHVSHIVYHLSCVTHLSPTAVLKGKGAQWQEIARFARLHATYFYLDPLVL